MTTQHDRRLIEDSLPLEAISAQSAREKSIRHGHISTLHIWWARRPLAAMRAAIFASLIPAPQDEEERAYLNELVADISDWDHVKNGNSPRIEEAKALIKKHYPDAPPKVLDPFMGGGSTGLEALRLGCEAHGVELNPVAYLIELCTLVYPQKYGQPVSVQPQRRLTNAEQGELPGMETLKQRSLDDELPEDVETAHVIQNPLTQDVLKWGNWVLEEAHKQIGDLYNTGGKNTPIAYLWARTVTCPNPMCKARIPLVRQYWLQRGGEIQRALRPVIDTSRKTVAFEVVSDNEIDFDPGHGTMLSGSASCLVCGSSVDGAYLRVEALEGRMGQQLICIVESDSIAGGKHYRAAGDHDLLAYEKAIEFLTDEAHAVSDHVLDETISPIRPSPNARGTSGLTRYGLTRFADLFNARQTATLYAFGKALETAIEQLAGSHDVDYAIAIATYLALALDKVADYNSTVATWDSSRASMRNTFPRQAIQMVWDYAEINPFSGSSGDWSNAIDWIVRVINHTALASEKPAQLRIGDATRLIFSDRSLDAIITDPPYYDSVPYSDLADFFYVILRHSLRNIYPDLFVTPLTPKSAEIVEHARHGNGDQPKQFYERQMTLAFSEVKRVLATEGICIVVFAHTSTSAWETLINSLLGSGLVVTASWPLHTELSNRIRAVGTASLASSIFIVCRKRTATNEGVFDDVQVELRARIKERLDFFWSQGIRGADFFISAIGPAVEVFGRYSSVRRLSGQMVSVSDLLTLIQETVADYALGKVLNGRYRMGTVDAPTRFYVMYRWSYGKEKLPFDDARRLAQALGAEVDELIHRLDLLKQSGEDVDLLGPLQREKVDRLGERGRDGSDAPLIDLVHKAALLWRAGDRVALANYLTTHAMGREDALRAVAQALVNVLPEGDRERQILEGFLAGQDNLPPPNSGRDVRLPGME